MLPTLLGPAALFHFVNSFKRINRLICDSLAIATHVPQTLCSIRQRLLTDFGVVLSLRQLIKPSMATNIIYLQGLTGEFEGVFFRMQTNSGPLAI